MVFGQLPITIWENIVKHEQILTYNYIKIYSNILLFIQKPVYENIVVVMQLTKKRYELLLTLSVPSTMYPLIQEDNLLILPTLNCKMIDRRTRHEKASPNGFRH